METTYEERLLKERYCVDGEKDWSDICKRVANYIGNDSDQVVNFMTLMLDKDFLPNSPTLMNSGTANPMLSACFFIDVEDSIDSIFDANKNAAKIFQRGGGVGFNFSKIRPAGSKVGRRNGVASGVVSFMHVFDTMTEVVKQGGSRRGAMMGCLDITHPEIKKFITCKSTEGDLSNFNISVKLTDEFMKSPDPEIMNLIVNGIYKNGEPGILFKDTIEKYNPAPEYGELNCNPCLYENTYLFTNNGLEKIKDLKSPLYDGSNFIDGKSWATGIKSVVKVTTKSGYEYITTPDHLFMLSDNNWCKAIDLKDKNIKHAINEMEWVGTNPYENIDYEMAGFLFGDGSYHIASGYVKYVYFTPIKDQVIIDKFKATIGGEPYQQGRNKLMMNIPINSIYSTLYKTRIEYRGIPDWIMTLPKENMRSFIRGLFSANGCNLSKYSKIQLVSINKSMLQQIQQMLTLFGIKAKLWVHNKSTDIEFSNGIYNCKESYHLVLSRESYVKYMKNIGFIQSYKNEFIQKKWFGKEYDYEKVISVETIGELPVYDFNSPNSHYGITNGAIVHNCSEALLTSGESCNLGSINLLNHIKNNTIDYDKLTTTIDSAVVFLNNVINKNKYPIPEIDFASKRTRKIGLGIMGFHDALIKMGIPYSSNKALNIAEEVMKFINDRAHVVSESLGKNPNIKQNRMNASLTSIAPTGTISIIAGASSGIEPVFNWVYTRKDTMGEHYIVHPLFEEALKEWYRGNSRSDYEDVIKHCHEKGTIRDIDFLPESFRTLFTNAMDIPSSMHVQMQAAFQKNVDMSISKTINLPNSATKEEIRQVIFDAWKSGCKGLTIYRNGSRENEVLSLKKPVIEDKIVDWIDTENAFYESKTPAIIYKVHSGCGKFYVIIGHDKEEPTMIFVEGDGVGGCNANMAAMGRSISAGLEWGTPAENYVKQFSKVKCMTAMNNKKSCGKSCADITGKCIDDSIKTLQPKEIVIGKNEEKCCDNPHYVMEGGCRICTNCGKSRCS